MPVACPQCGAPATAQTESRYYRCSFCTSAFIIQEERGIERLTFSHRCPEASAVAACRSRGIRVEPGMEIGYVVTDARTWSVELDWAAERFDQGYYLRMLGKAWEEISFALGQAGG